MAKRKSISQKTRFEVFKRDSFKCQYCGRSAPEVILHVDHINPVAAGGSNEMTNYLTACSECNHGKGARKLDDSDEIKKQKKALDELNERRSQLEMMVQWRNELSELNEMEVSIVDDELCRKFGKELTDAGKRIIAATIRKYGLNAVLDSLDDANSHSMNGKSLVETIDTICYFNKINSEKPYLKDLYYVRGILRNRLKDYESLKQEAMPGLESMFLRGTSIDELKSAAVDSDSWEDFLSRFN